MFYAVVWLVLFSSMIFFMMDVMDMPFMEVFDTDIPLNGWFYVLYLLWFIMSVNSVEGVMNGKK